jgi:hypothetical protein
MNGWELDELHDVSITSVANNDALIYESSSQLWKNKTIASALGYTPVPTTRTLTINGTTFDLSANRSWTVSSDNIYTANGTLTGNRTLDMSTFVLNFSNRINFSTNPSGSNDVPLLEIGSTSAIGLRHQFGQLRLSRSLNPSSSVTINPFNTDNLFIGGDPANVTLGSIGVRIGGATDLGNSARLQVQAGAVGAVQFNATNVMRFLLVSTATNGRVWNLTSDNTGDFILGQTYASITNSFRVFGATNNIGINIGAGLDAGFKLDVNGTARVSGMLTVTTDGAQIKSSISSFFEVLDRFGQRTFMSGGETTGGITVGNTGISSAAGRWVSLILGTGVTSAYGGFRFHNINDQSVTVGRMGFFGNNQLWVQTNSSDVSSQLALIASSSTLYLGYFTYNTLPASAALAVKSTTQGFLPPQMTTSQKTSIASPVAGLQVYDITLNQMSYYNGTTWINF